MRSSTPTPRWGVRTLGSTTHCTIHLICILCCSCNEVALRLSQVYRWPGQTHHRHFAQDLLLASHEGWWGMLASFMTMHSSTSTIHTCILIVLQLCDVRTSTWITGESNRRCSSSQFWRGMWYSGTSIVRIPLLPYQTVLIISHIYTYQTSLNWIGLNHVYTHTLNSS